MGIFSSLTPGGWIGDILKNALTGPLIGGLVDSYKAKLSSGTTQDQMLADLAGRELAVEQRERELAVQQNISDEGRWWTAAPRALVAWSMAIFIVKCVVWDTMLGLGSTPALKGQLGDAFQAIIIMWFGGRTIEKVSKIISTRFAK
jgi:hypothetical protein